MSTKSTTRIDPRRAQAYQIAEQRHGRPWPELAAHCSQMSIAQAAEFLGLTPGRAAYLLRVQPEAPAPKPRPERSPAACAPTVSELAENIRRNARKMDSLLNHGDDRDSAIVDYCAHIDNLAEQIQNDVRRHLVTDF